MIGGELDADGHRPLWVHCELQGRLTAAGATPADLDQEVLGNEIIDDVGDGLGCELSQPADLGAAEGAVAADRLEHDAAIVPAIALGVAADRKARGNIEIGVSGHMPSSGQRREIASKKRPSRE
jgi:hypothetical protein